MISKYGLGADTWQRGAQKLFKHLGLLERISDFKIYIVWPSLAYKHGSGFKVAFLHDR